MNGETKTRGTLWKRSLYCGAVRLPNAGQQVVLVGWAQKVRDMGNLAFIDLRDREGIVQIVFRSEDRGLLDDAKNVRAENIIAVRGVVKAREAKDINPGMASGEIEVEASELEVISAGKTPPFV
ncbi:MAG: OB-fold nucleic acid binding domain-containing protein, partial [Acidobacteriota bacterium]|nr:OB-fold nucleic acid binding domain-containing protein [Acidobacteriota bacterium]